MANSCSVDVSDNKATAVPLFSVLLFENHMVTLWGPYGGHTTSSCSISHAIDDHMFNCSQPNCPGAGRLPTTHTHSLSQPGTRKMSYLDHNNYKDSQLTNNEIN